MVTVSIVTNCDTRHNLCSALSATFLSHMLCVMLWCIVMLRVMMQTTLALNVIMLIVMLLIAMMLSVIMLIHVGLIVIILSVIILISMALSDIMLIAIVLHAD